MSTVIPRELLCDVDQAAERLGTNRDAILWLVDRRDVAIADWVRPGEPLLELSRFPVLLDPERVAEAKGVPVEAVRALIRAGRLPTVTFGPSDPAPRVRLEDIHRLDDPELVKVGERLVVEFAARDEYERAHPVPARAWTVPENVAESLADELRVKGPTPEWVDNLARALLSVRSDRVVASASETDTAGPVPAARARSVRKTPKGQ